MTITYRTTDVAKWGTGKGSPLQPVEVDTNFWELDQRIIVLEQGDGSNINGIESIQVIGSQMTIFTTDGNPHGPFTLPKAMIRYRGVWQPETSYAAMDLTLVENDGLYLVLKEHMSLLEFNKTELDAENNLIYQWLLPVVEGGVGEAPINDSVYNRTNGAWEIASFLKLFDTPLAYSNHAGKAVIVNSDETGLTYTDMPQVTDITNETNFKDNVQFASTDNIDLTAGGLLVVDGEQTVEDNRILVKDQTTKAENGLYLAKSGSWVRTEDGATLDDLEGMVVFVEEGEINGGALFALTSGSSSEIIIKETQVSRSLSLLRAVNDKDYTITPKDLGRWLIVRGSHEGTDVEPNIVRIPEMLPNETWPRHAELVIQQRGPGPLTVIAHENVAIWSSVSGAITNLDYIGAEIIFPHRDDILRLKIRGHNGWMAEASFSLPEPMLVRSATIADIVVLTQTAYDELDTKNPNTFYLIEEIEE